MLSFSDAHDQPKNCYNLQSSEGYAQFLSPERVSDCVHQGDGEFKPHKEFMLELYGAPRLNLTSANEHVPEIEHEIRVIKERVRAVMYGTPFNAVPPIICISAVLFVTKQLNLFPVKGGILANYSLK